MSGWWQLAVLVAAVVGSAALCLRARRRVRAGRLPLRAGRGGPTVRVVPPPASAAATGDLVTSSARDGDSYSDPEDALTADREEEVEENQPRSGVPGKDEHADG